MPHATPCADLPATLLQAGGVKQTDEGTAAIMARRVKEEE